MLFRRLSLYLLIIITGILIAASFSPWNIWPAGLLGAVLLIFTAENYDKITGKKMTLRCAISSGFLLSLVIDVLAYHWLIYTIVVFGHMPWYIAIFVFLGYVIITSSRFILFFYLISKIKQATGNLAVHQKARMQPDIRSIYRFALQPLFAATIAWGISEFLGWQLFPWFGANLMGSNDLFMQAADITGTRGLSLIWFAVAYALYLLLKRLAYAFDRGMSFKTAFKPARYRFFRPVAASLLLFLIIHIYGFFAMSYYKDVEKQADTSTVAVIQGNTPMAFEHIRNMNNELKRIIRFMARQTVAVYRQAQTRQQNIDLFIWPESAVPFVSYDTYGYLRMAIKQLQNYTQTDIVFNDAASETSRENRNGTTRYKLKTYSNVRLIDKQMNEVENYQKVFLLPFGEYIPLAHDHYPELYRVFPEIAGFARGNRFHLFNSQAGLFLPLVCYEVIAPEFSLDFFQKTGKKAEFIVNLTNDAWFGDSIESAQHLELGRIRAIELRRPIVRATNSGITAMVDITGGVHNPTEKFVAENVIYRVAKIPAKYQTLFSYWGNIPYYLFIGGSAILLALAMVSQKRRQSKTA